MVGLDAFDRHDGEIDGALAQQSHRLAARMIDHLQRDTRRLGHHRGGEPRHQQDREIVRAADAEGLRGGGWIETRHRRERVLHLAERQTDRLAQRQRALGRHHAVAFAHEQLIAEDLP